MTSTHGSHSSNNTGSHSNSNSQPTTPDAASHKVSWGATLRTTAYTSEAITSNNNLNLLVNAINDIRRSVGASVISRSSVTNESQLQSAVSALASLSITRHQWGTVSLTGHGSTNGGHSSHSNQSGTNNASSENGCASITCASTNASQTISIPQRYPGGQVTLTVGSITYSSTPQTLLNNLNAKMLLSSYLPSFGSYTGTITNHSSHSSSHSNCSEEMKESIEDLKLSALDLIKKINLVAFNYKESIGEDSTIRHYGFLAEKTDEAFSTHYHDRMDYTNCIGLLLKAVQELSDKIDSLEKK